MSNLHETLPEAQLHNPKGFSLSTNNSFATKDISGALFWDRIFWQHPILKIVDGALAPPTENDGDRYIIVQLTSSVINANWDGALFNNIVQFYSPINLWRSIIPANGFVIKNKDTGKIHSLNGINWKEEGGLSINYGKILWLNNINGNDAIADKGRFDLPFKTLQAAINAAIAGDKIISMGDISDKNVILKDKVDLIIHGNWVKNSNESEHLSKDNGITIECNIFANGDIANNSGAGNVSCFELTGLSTKLNVWCRKLGTNSAEIFAFIVTGGGSSEFNLHGTLISGVLVSNSHEINIYGDVIFRGNNKQVGGRDGFFTIHGNVDMVSSNGILTSFNEMVIVKGDIRNTSGNAIFINSGGTIICHGNILSSASNAIFFLDSGSISIYKDVVSISAITIFISNTAINEFTDNTFYLKGKASCLLNDPNGHVILIEALKRTPDKYILDNARLICKNATANSIKTNKNITVHTYNVRATNSTGGTGIITAGGGSDAITVNVGVL